MIEDLSAEAFLMCLRRFISRCGRPKQIICDNAPQFKVIKNVCDKMWKNIFFDEDVRNYCANERLVWKFITQLSPWKGGIYERLVALVKNSLKKTIGKVCLLAVHLETFIAEAEATINTRPLIYVDDEVGSHYICPSDFLKFKAQDIVNDLPEQDEENDEDFIGQSSTRKNILRLWKTGHKHLERFWTIWRDQYLLSMRERSQSQLKQGRVLSKEVPRIGDVVTIKDNLP
jgi:hypothetical protein